MTRNTIVTVLFVIWAGLFAASFIFAATAAPTDMGFTRGLNRVAGFLGWQAGAFVAALGAILAGGGLPKEARGYRWLARTPMLGEFCLVLAIAVMIAYGLITHHPGQDMPPALEPAPPTFG
jgi:hypothetical protein